MDLQSIRYENDKRVEEHREKENKIKAQAIQEYINSQRGMGNALMGIVKK